MDRNLDVLADGQVALSPGTTRCALLSADVVPLTIPFLK